MFSNNFELDAFSHNGSLTFKYVDKKWRAAAGSGVSAVTLRLHDLFAQTTNSYHFFNITPQVGVNFSPKPQTGINFNYRGNTRQPTIDQLQPIRDNSDPLNVFLGNPDLKVGFNHSLSLGFNKSKPLKGVWMYASVSYNLSSNDIAFKTTIDSSGAQTYQPVNVNGNRRWWAWTNWSRDRGNQKLSYGFQTGGNGSRTNSFVNNNPNVSTFANINFHPNISYRWDDHFNIQFGPEVQYNISRSSLQPNRNANYFVFGGDVEGSVELPFKMQLSMNARFDVRQDVAGFGGTPNNYLVNGELTRKFFKDNSLLLKLTVNDLFNQNVGFNRNFDSNIINEERYNRIARYFMLRLEWNFSKMGTGATK
ncbi:MAG: hypothetical protein EOO15_14835 [Chitinophagaceae bacterium]|nr:MAG: hypothetical protein EOO15_14835 [Chitinophagaceae bacterium]